MELPDGNNQPSTRQLTAAIASGSTEAFATFYEEWFDRCLDSAMKMTGFDEPTALDIVQDAMMTAATQLPRFNDEPQLKAWLDRVMRWSPRVCFNQAYLDGHDVTIIVRH